MFPTVGKDFFRRNVGSHEVIVCVCTFCAVLKHCFNMPNRENNVSRAENIWKHAENIVSATKMFLNLFGNIFCPWAANFVSPTMFPEGGKTGKHWYETKYFHNRYNARACQLSSTHNSDLTSNFLIYYPGPTFTGRRKHFFYGFKIFSWFWLRSTHKMRQIIYRVYQKKGNRPLACYRAFNI